MARTLSPFTRISLLITELNSNRIEDLGKTERCDLARHTARLIEDVEEPSHVEMARNIDASAAVLLAEIGHGRFEAAEAQRTNLVATCKSLKDLL